MFSLQALIKTSPESVNLKIDNFLIWSKHHMSSISKNRQLPNMVKTFNYIFIVTEAKC